MSWPVNHAIKVAVGIIINAQQQLLIAQRPMHASYAGHWEFPGGKFELHETPLQALKRELEEEIGIIVSSAAPLIIVRHQYENAFVELHVWLVEKFSNTPYGREGQYIRWVTRDELHQLNFLAGNQTILDIVHQMLVT